MLPNRQVIVVNLEEPSINVDDIYRIVVPFINNQYSGFEAYIEECQNKSFFIEKCLELCLNGWTESFETSLNNPIYADVSEFLKGTLKHFFENSNNTVFQGKQFTPSELEAAKVFARLALLKAVFNYCEKNRDLVSGNIIGLISTGSETLLTSYNDLSVIKTKHFFRNSTVDQSHNDATVNFIQAAITGPEHKRNMKLCGLIAILCLANILVTLKTDLDWTIKTSFSVGVLLFSIYAVSRSVKGYNNVYRFYSQGIAADHRATSQLSKNEENILKLILKPEQIQSLNVSHEPEQRKTM